MWHWNKARVFFSLRGFSVHFPSRSSPDNRPLWSTSRILTSKGSAIPIPDCREERSCYFPRRNFFPFCSEIHVSQPSFSVPHNLLFPWFIEDVGHPRQHTLGANIRSSSKPEYHPLRSLNLFMEVSRSLEGEYNRCKVVTIALLQYN